MRTVGLVLIAVGIALLAFVGYTFVRDRSQTLSPVPEDKGVKVIFVTPTP